MSRLPGSRLDRGVHRGGQPIPAVDGFAEPPAAGRGQPVVLGTPVVLGDPPLGGEQALMLEAMERRIQRVLFDPERPTRDLLDALQHAVAVLGVQREGLENQQIERAGEEFRLFACPQLLTSINEERMTEARSAVKKKRTGGRSATKPRRGFFRSIRVYEDVGRCARRNERMWRTARGIRSFGSFHGNMLTSAFGASIAASMATA